MKPSRTAVAGTPAAMAAVALLAACGAQAADFEGVLKIEAACRFAAATGKLAAIGPLADAPRRLAGEAGTVISRSGSGPGHGTAADGGTE